jgi:hypothetical protein
MAEPKRVDYQPKATWASDLQVLKSMMFADVKGSTQQERLESFYVTQVYLPYLSKLDLSLLINYHICVYRCILAFVYTCIHMYVCV